jgi:hypothetical protein
MRARPTTNDTAAAVPLWRLARRLWPHGNPLARAADRVEAAALLILVLVGLVMTPLAAASGSEAYANQRAVTEQQNRNRQPTTAVLLADPPPLSVTSPGRVVHGRTPAQARWSLPDGSVRTGQVQADDWLRAGAELPIWIDQSGNPVDRPATADTAIVAGLRAALTSWLAVMAVLAAGFAALCLLLSRSRKAGWHREWASVEPAWTGRTAS